MATTEVLVACFERLEDSRIANMCRHKLLDSIVIAVFGEAKAAGSPAVLPDRQAQAWGWRDCPTFARIERTIWRGHTQKRSHHTHFSLPADLSSVWQMSRTPWDIETAVTGC